MDRYLMASFNTILDQLGVEIPGIILLTDQTIQKIKYVFGLLKNPKVKTNGIVSFRFYHPTVFLSGNYEKELEVLLDARKNKSVNTPSIVTPHLVESNQGFEYAISNSSIKVNTNGFISIEFKAYCSDSIPENVLFSLSEEIGVNEFLAIFENNNSYV